MVTKELIKALRKNQKSYIRTLYDGFDIEIYEDYNLFNQSIYKFKQDGLQIENFIDIACPKSLSYLLKVNDTIRVKIYENSYGKESKLYQSGFNYRMTFLRIYRKNEFLLETLVSTEVKEIR